MIFQKEMRVRYSETDKNGIMTVDAIVDYLQDIIMLHAEESGMGFKQIEKLGTVWFLSTWQVVINRAPRMYEKITVKTNPYGFKGFFGNRNAWIEDENGEIIVKANSIWVYLELKNLVPKRVDKEAVETYYPLEPMLEMDYAPRKIAMPKYFTPLPPVPVKYSNLDVNNHVNNCQYIKVAMDVTDITKTPRELLVEYKKSALPGDVFYPNVCEIDNSLYVDLRDNEDVSFATIVFKF